jgi:hypothetical protein
MDFSSILGGSSSSSGESKGHPATILKTVQNNGAFKVYTDVTGHVQRTEIAVPEGRIIIIKDYETMPVLSHYRAVTVLSPQEVTLGALSIVPEDRKRPNSTSRFFDGNNLIGTGTGDIGIAIAMQLISISVDQRLVDRSSIDLNVITSIKAFLQGKS